MGYRDGEGAPRGVDPGQKHGAAFGAEFEDVQLADGLTGTQIANPNLPLPLTYAVAKNHLFLSTNPERVVEALTKWGTADSKSLAKDGDVFSSVLKGLTGGGADNLAGLLYVNVRGALKAAGHDVLELDIHHTDHNFGNVSRDELADRFAAWIRGAS